MQENRLNRASVALSIALALFCGTIASAQTGFGLGGNQADDGRAIAVDSNGNVYLTGTFRQTVDFDPGPGVFELDAGSTNASYVASYTEAGALRYAFMLTTSATLLHRGIAVDSNGNICLSGGMSGTTDFDPGPGEEIRSPVDGRIFVAGYDANGDYRFAVNMGVTSVTAELANAVTMDNLGQCHVAGQFVGETDFDPTAGEFILESNGNSDIFVAKYSAAGGFLDAFGVGGQFGDRALGIAVDAAGNRYVTGEISSEVDMDPGPLVQNIPHAGADDIFLASYDASNNLRYALSIGDTGGDLGESVDVDAAGNAFITGRFDDEPDFDPGPGTLLLDAGSNSDLFLASYDSSGDLRFAFNLGNGNPVRGDGIAVDATGGPHVTGRFGGTLDFDPSAGDASITVFGTSALVASYDNNGNYRNAYVYTRSSGSGTVEGNGIALDAQGNARVIGTFNSTVDLDPGPGVVTATTNGSNDSFYSSFRVAPAFPGPGHVAAPSLTLDKAPTPGNLILSWNPSCSASMPDYGVFEGVLGSFSSHSPLTCVDNGLDNTEEVISGAGDRYYLVVPLTVGAEGSYGLDGSGAERPIGSGTCRAARDTTRCP
ncbi:hypothetical protein ABI59_20755 [Acidobacteria bacterium Mor1]|nr:hypothetical protein ABI59_20755 [Acidobacteria bacterium Mor1]